MPFYFGAPYAPAAFWRHLEAYTPVRYGDAAGAGVLQWRDIVNYVGRGMVTTLSNFHTIARNYRMSIDGGAWILFSLTNTEIVTKVISFGTSIQIQHERTVASGVHSTCWVLQE